MEGSAPRARIVRRSNAVVSLLALAALVAAPGAGLGQHTDSNIMAPTDEIERRLSREPFEIQNMPGSRFEGDRTFRPVVRFADGKMMRLQLAPAPEGGGEFNNEPRYEIAAYELQKLFLDPAEYVVPPTVLRCLPVETMRRWVPGVKRTFDEWPIAVVVLQYWLWNVEISDAIDDDDRLETNETYARHVGNLNLLTFLIRHEDSNLGNFLVSTDSANPRVFSVDNGLAFRPFASNRGNYWRHLRLDRYPARTIERLRQLDLEALRAALGVVAEWELQPDGSFQVVEPSANLDPGDGIRRTQRIIQLGLTDSEIRDIHGRLERLLERVDDGRYELF